MARSRSSNQPPPPPPPTNTASVDNRASYLQPKHLDTFCRMHKCGLDETGWCPVAQAYWYPRFVCPHCYGWLYDNGFCPNCTPKRREFPGDYFEARWDELAGREYGHYVRIHKGPTPVLTDEQLAEYTGQLRAIARQITMRQPGDESEQEADCVPF